MVRTTVAIRALTGMLLAASPGVWPWKSKSRRRLGSITTTDGTVISYMDSGSGQAIVFSHGWPLSADDWDSQMLFFLQHGYRVIAHDRTTGRPLSRPSRRRTSRHR